MIPLMARIVAQPAPVPGKPASPRLGRVSRTALLLAALVGPLLPRVVEGNNAPCPDIRIQAETGLALGTVRTLPGARGFLELHPRHGISTSSDGVVHQGPWGHAVLYLTGPPEQRVDLELAVQQTSDHHTASLHLAELIVRHSTETTRLEAAGETLSVRLPSRERPDGSARLQLEIGAVAAFRHHVEAQQAHYRLTAACLSTRP